MSNPFDSMFGGCLIDTIRLDTFQKGGCSAIGYSNTHSVSFSVGDAWGGDWAYFTQENTYRVEWTGVCAAFTTAQCSVGKQPNGDISVTATIYRISDGARLGTIPITAKKQVETQCLPTNPVCKVPL